MLRELGESDGEIPRGERWARVRELSGIYNSDVSDDGWLMRPG